MSGTIRIFVDERGLDVAAGATLGEVLAQAAPDAVGALEAGRTVVTDGTGREISLQECPQAGAIYRVVRSARRAARQPEAK